MSTSGREDAGTGAAQLGQTGPGESRRIKDGVKEKGIRPVTAAPPGLAKWRLGNRQPWVASRRVRGHFPFVSLSPAASVGRGDELMSKEPLGRGLLKGQVGGRCPPRY